MFRARHGKKAYGRKLYKQVSDVVLRSLSPRPGCTVGRPGDELPHETHHEHQAHHAKLRENVQVGVMRVRIRMNDSHIEWLPQYSEIVNDSTDMIVE